MTDYKLIAKKFSSESEKAYKLKKNSLKIVGGILKFLFILGLSYQFLFPLFYMIVTTFQNPNTLDPSVLWIPSEFSLAGLKGAIENLDYLKAIGMTASITVLSTLLLLVSCSMVGYGFARYEFPFKNIVFLLVVLTIIVPPQTLIMSNYVQFRYFDFGGLLKPFGVSLNLLGTHWVFTLPSLFASGLRCGLFIFIFRQFFTGLPKELEEAAEIDGCGAIKTFTRVMIPMASSSYITVMLFSVVWHWNEYYNSAVYFTGDIKPLSVRLLTLKDSLEMSGLVSQNNLIMNRCYMMGGVLITILPLLILYVFTQKFFTESVERSGIVG